MARGVALLLFLCILSHHVIQSHAQVQQILCVACVVGVFAVQQIIVQEEKVLIYTNQALFTNNRILLKRKVTIIKKKLAATVAFPMKVLSSLYSLEL